MSNKVMVGPGVTTGSILPNDFDRPTVQDEIDGIQRVLERAQHEVAMVLYCSIEDVEIDAVLRRWPR